MGLPSVGVLTTLLAVGVPAFFWVKTAGRAWMMRTFTAQPDLKVLSKPRDRPKVKGTAVVCGGSFAGLFSVSVLAEHFERVVIIEPETFVFTEEARTPATTYPTRDIVDGPTGTPMRALAHKRTRVAQYDIFHVYQALTTRFLRAIFPTFDKRADEHNVQVVSTDHGLHFGGRRHKTPMRNLRTRDNEVIFKHRRGMETFVRGLVAEKFNPKGLDGSDGTGNVEFIKGTATAFNLDSTGKTITSVSYRDADGQTVNIESALVLDCTGNTQAGLKLVSRALQLPNLTEEIRVEFNPKMNYCSFEVPLPADFHERVDKLGITETDSNLPRTSRSDGFWMGWVPTPEVDNRTFLVANQGTDRGDLTVGGWDTDLPLTWDTAVEFVKGIDNPHAPPAWILKVIDIMGDRSEEALVSLVRFKASSRIFYENKADILPTNFIAHGDSIMRVNPRRGEGTTKSCLGAVTLNALLHEQDPSNPAFGATFFHRLSTRTGPLWDAAKWLDYGRESTVPCKGETREVGKLFRWYHRNLELVMAKHEYPSEMFWRILNWDAPTFDVMTPSIIFQVCKVSLLGEKWA